MQKKFYNSIINKTPIDASTNRIIGGRAPSLYLDKLREKDPSLNLDVLLRSHWIDIKHLQADDFATSFVNRGLHMLELIGNAMGRELDLDNGRIVFLDALKAAGQYVDQYVEEEEEYDDFGEFEVMELFDQQAVAVD